MNRAQKLIKTCEASISQQLDDCDDALDRSKVEATTVLKWLKELLPKCSGKDKERCKSLISWAQSKAYEEEEND